MGHMLARAPGATDASVRVQLVREMEAFLERDVADNIAIGEVHCQVDFKRFLFNY